MASLRRKPSGLWYLRWKDASRIPPSVEESLKTNDPSRAKKLKVRLEYQYLEGTHDPWMRRWYDNHSDELLEPSLTEALDGYIADRSARRGRKSWNPVTARQTVSVLRRLVNSCGDPQAARLDERHLIGFYDRPGDRSPHTTAFEHRIIRSFCRWMSEQGYTDKMIDVDVPAPQQTVPEFLTDDMLDKVCDLKISHIEGTAKYAASGDSLWHIDAWRLAAATGMRKSEIGALTVDAIRGDTIIVGYRHRTKSGKQRAIPMLFEAKDILATYLDPEARAADPRFAGSDLVFGRGRQGIDRMAREFSACCRKLWPARKELSFHSLRHTFAIRYLTAPSNAHSNDFRLVKLQLILGHADISTTMKYLKIDTGRLGF